jgi:hypothetical protein
MATATSRTLGIGALFLVVFLAAAAVAPLAGAQVIQACDGGLDGNVTYSQSYARTILSYNVCLANAITGLRSITSFTYYLKFYNSGTPIQVSAIIIDVTDSYSAVEAIDVSHLLPPGLSEQAVTASFASPVALDPLRTYYLAFCAYSSTGSSSLMFTTPLGQEAHVREYCYFGKGCTSPSTAQYWEEDANVILTDIVGSCQSPPSPSTSPSAPPPGSPTPSPSPSPSPSASPSLSPSPSPSPSSASPSLSPSPSSASPAEKSNSDRLTPGESFGARAVRFVLGHCSSLLFL